MLATQKVANLRSNSASSLGEAIMRCRPSVGLHATRRSVLMSRLVRSLDVTSTLRRTHIAAGVAVGAQAQQQRQAVAAEQDDEAVESQAVAAEEGPEKAPAAGLMPAETEAVARAGTSQQQQPEMVSEEVVEEVEQVMEPLTFKSAVAQTRSFLTSKVPGKLIMAAVGALFLGTLGLAAYRAWQKSNTAQARRMRQIDRNRDLVDGINKYLLANNRAGLTPGILRRLQRASGFTPVEVFRKYLWYLLRERKFDQGAVEDLAALKVGLGLTDVDVGEALRERSARIYEKYGTLMLNTEGLTLAGAQRKATCTALFRKVLYLAECERLVGSAATAPGGSGDGSVADIGKIFGATLEDMERLRIRNLYEAELDLEGMVVDSTDEQEDGPLPGAPASGSGSGSGLSQQGGADRK